ncbi:hypothetical protein AB0I68_02290 [Streptomyces sp. NPDC050448]|uniref:hypothetical protein n=1 Tax=Streptomyces sp. NPDC050448 TaxID=3155404 RepID=UPI0034300EB2
MGGREDTGHGRIGRRLPRHAVIAVALPVLLGALFLCVRPGEAHTVSAVRGPVHGHGTHAVCASPDELPGCSPFSHVAPGVLPAPPPAVTVAGSAPDPAGRCAGRGPARPHGTLARAPDLHALQVLRT